jgi:hypothetical protein
MGENHWNLSSGFLNRKLNLVDPVEQVQLRVVRRIRFRKSLAAESSNTKTVGAKNR